MKIKKKFKKIPNTGHLDIWLQRLAIGFNKPSNFDEPICKIVSSMHQQDDQSIQIWESNWLKENLRGKINSLSIVDSKKLTDVIGHPIENKEVNMFFKYY